MKHYSGRREGRAVIVTVDGRRLNPRLDLWNHSPNGFEWGYVGSGPGKITLYKGKEIVKRGVDSSIALEELINLLKDNEAWADEPN